jgi:hypothetical protein
MEVAVAWPMPGFTIITLPTRPARLIEPEGMTMAINVQTPHYVKTARETEDPALYQKLTKFIKLRSMEKYPVNKP